MSMLNEHNACNEQAACGHGDNMLFLLFRVFFKHRDNNFFQPSAFVLAMVICRLPFVCVEAAIYSCIVYFWVGFQVGPGYFFLFYLIMVSTMLVMAAIFRLNASTSPDLTIANAAGRLTCAMHLNSWLGSAV